MDLFPVTNQTPGVVLLRRYAAQVRDGHPFEDAAGALFVDLGGQLTRSEVETLLLTQAAGPGPEEGWCHHPTISTMDKLLAARV